MDPMVAGVLALFVLMAGVLGLAQAWHAGYDAGRDDEADLQFKMRAKKWRGDAK